MASLSSLVLFVFLPAFLLAEITCPEGFTLLNGRKCVRSTDYSSSHNYSANDCKSFGGNIVTITNKEDNDAISIFASNLDLQYFWVGSFCFTINSNVTCYNDDGSGITMNNWLQGYPKRSQFECVYSESFWSNGSPWETNTCHTGCSTICEVPTTIADPTCKYNYNGYCYYPSTEMSGVTQSTTFPKAQAICKSINANMVSIHSKGEVDYIKSIFQYSNITQITLGAQAFQAKQFNWVDGSSFDFTYPNPYDNFTGNCLQMNVLVFHDSHVPFQDTNPLQGMWSEINCQVFNYFLCKRKISSSLEEEPVKKVIDKKPSSIHYDLADPSNCNNTLLIAPGVITSFGYGSSPLPKVRCWWHLATLGSYQLGIYFTDLSIYSAINVRDDRGNLLKQVRNRGAPYSMLMPGNVATLDYSSEDDASNGDHGFRAVAMPY